MLVLKISKALILGKKTISIFLICAYNSIMPITIVSISILLSMYLFMKFHLLHHNERYFKLLWKWVQIVVFRILFLFIWKATTLTWRSQIDQLLFISFFSINFTYNAWKLLFIEILHSILLISSLQINPFIYFCNYNKEIRLHSLIFPYYFSVLFFHQFLKLFFLTLPFSFI